MRRAYIVSYDISDPKRLRKTFKLMKAWGDHIQLSVFYCELSRSELVQLKGDLVDIIHQGADQVLFIDAGPANDRTRASIEAVGKPFAAPPRGPVFV